MLTILAKPTEQLITLDEAKAFLLVDDTYQDATITALISGIREECELVSGYALGVQTLQLQTHMSRYETLLSLPRPPFISLTSASVTDGTDVEDVLTSTKVYGGGKLLLPYRYDTNLEYTLVWQAGYSAANLPAWLKTAMLQLLAFRFENREGGPVPPSIQATLAQNRYRAR